MAYRPVFDGNNMPQFSLQENNAEREHMSTAGWLVLFLLVSLALAPADEAEGQRVSPGHWD